MNRCVETEVHGAELDHKLNLKPDPAPLKYSN